MPSEKPDPPTREWTRLDEPHIFVPRPPKGWIPIRVRTVKQAVLIFVGAAILLSQAALPYFDREPSWGLLAAGAGCFGIYFAQQMDNRHKGGGGNDDSR